MWSQAGLPGQEGLWRRESPDGTRTTSGEIGNGELGGGDPSSSVHREDLHRQDHGGERKTSADGFDQQDGNQSHISAICGSPGEVGAHGRSPCATSSSRSGSSKAKQSRRRRGEEHIEEREGGTPDGERCTPSEAGEGRGEGGEDQRHDECSKGERITGEGSQGDWQGEEEGSIKSRGGQVMAGDSGQLRGRGGWSSEGEGSSKELGTLKGALQRLRLRMRGAESTRDSETEALVRVLPETGDTRHSDTTFLHEEEPTRDTTISTTTLQQPEPDQKIPEFTTLNTHGVQTGYPTKTCGCVRSHGQDLIREEERSQSKKNIVTPTTAKRISTGMAALGAMLVMPVQGLMAQMAGCPDFVEVACSPTSSLSEEMTRLGFVSKRVNYKEGFDLEKPSGTRMLKHELTLHPPGCAWISLPCTRLSPLVNLTERSPEEWARFEQRQERDLKRAEEVGDGLVEMIEKRPSADFAWEWPTGAVKGWKSKAIRKLVYKMHQLNKPVFWCRFHGCAYGLEFKGTPVQKSWTVLTTNRHIWLALQKKCPGHVEHAHCRGEVAKASSYYPKKMVQAVARGLADTWASREEVCDVSVVSDIEKYLLEVEGEKYEEEEAMTVAREEDPRIMALSRDRYPTEPPRGRKLEQIKQQMMRIHRASGHAPFSNLQRLLRMRKAPPWAVELAGSLECPECVESKRPTPVPPASTGDLPAMWEIVGTDIFEYEHQEMKHKFILWRDRATGYAYVEQLNSYTGAWEPNASHVVGSLIHWLMVNPRPTWIISDAGTIYTSEEFGEFAGKSGIGLLTAPAEAHHIMGPEEGCIGILKNSARRLLREEQGLSVDQVMALAVHGHNSTINSTGFSPFQWVRGGSCPQENLLPGLDPKKAFGGVLKLKEKARIAYEQEHAKQKLTKLNNAVVRRPMNYKVGSLVMLWRQRGKGHWTGPVRVLLQEGGTLWLASGSSLIKARLNQVRECSKREELEASVKGSAVYRNPVTLETLMRSFTGKHYTNVTGETPSQERMDRDMSQAVVRRQPQPETGQSIRGRGLKRKEAGDEADDETEAKRTSVRQEPREEEKKDERSREEDIGGDPIPRTELEEALDKRGANQVDGVGQLASETTGNQCAVRGCLLPGGHSGPHEDEAGNRFNWAPYSGRIPIEEDQDANNSDSSSSSSSSEELVTTPRRRVEEKRKTEEDQELFALEIEIEEEDLRYLSNHTKKAAVWLSRKMAEKSKEHQWQRLSLDRKQDFDLAQAKELSNVLQARALRLLTEQEWKSLDRKKVMGMRWVLTTKSGGDAKARLVVLGYQQHNLAQVQAAAPTMSRTSRNILLMTCANKKFTLRAGDVTSAFLQASQSLEEENLVVWAPAELAVLFGASPKDPVMPLKITRAFYGLVHAPRKWYEHVSNTLVTHGWERLVSDPCLFILKEKDEVVAIAGIHVDDFLIGGKEENMKYQKAKKALEEAYRWGKWEQTKFTFAGCQITQHQDHAIYIDQNDYTQRWLDEVEISKERAKEVKASVTPQEVSQMRGVIGSLAWRASQSSPHYQADVGLFLSELPYATVDTINRLNKLVRKVRRVPQHLIFPCWNVPWEELAILVWADASNSNRPDKSSTMGILGGIEPRGILATRNFKWHSYNGGARRRRGKCSVRTEQRFRRLQRVRMCASD